MAAILLILVVMLFYMNYQKEGEVRKLKKKIKILENDNSVLKEYVKRYMENAGENVTEYVAPKNESVTVNNIAVSKANTEVLEKKQEEVKNISKSKVTIEPVNKEDSRNTLILAAGAVFIILAAIVFLISTWSIIPNIVKTIILVVFIEVFLGLSKVAKEKFNLPNASNTFFYIAMAYVPICLYSISFFKLFGDFLSIDGSGRHIYFTIVNIIIAVIYMYEYNKKESKVLIYGSILMQYLSVIFFSLIFSTDVLRVLTCIGLYNLVLYIFMNKFECKNVLNLVFNVMVIALTVLSFSYFEQTLLMVGNLIVLAINYLCLEKINSKKVFAILFNICLTIAGTTFVSLFNIKDNIKEILSLIYIIAIFVIQNCLIVKKNKENLKFSSICVTIGAILILQFNSYIIDSTIPGYIYSLINVVILLMAHGMKDEFIKDVSSLLIPIEFISAYINLGIIHGANEHYFMICAILTFVLGECIKNPKLEKLNKMFFYVSHINVFLTMLTLTWENEEFFKNFVYLIIMTEIYGYSFIKNPKENRCCKYIDYVFTNISLFSICECFDLNVTIKCLIPFVTSAIFIVLEEVLPKLEEGKFFKDNFSEIYIALNSAVAIYFIEATYNIGIYLIGFIFIGLLIYRYYKNKENMFYNILPVIGYYFLASAMDINEGIQILLLSVSVIGFGWLSLKYKDVNIFTVAGYVSIMFISDLLENDIALSFAAFIYTLVHVYYMENDKFKDGYKVVTTIIFMSFYYEFLEIIGIDDIILFTLAGILGAFSYLSRNIINKYTKDIKIVEYVVIALVYLSFIGEATELADAISIIFVQVSFMLISYYKKYGSQFVANTAMLIVSGIYLTKGFWALIPWWLYLLVIGSVLIGMAVRNEAKENSEKINVGKIIDNVIEKIEK